MINVENLIYHYPKQPRLFDDLSLRLEAGNIVGLLGKNGAGKTTLLKLFTGLTFPISGNMDILGEIPEKRHPELLNSIFFVPEEFYLPPVTINEYCKAHRQFYPNFDRELLNRVLIEFELSITNNLSRLSQGQRKKFFIAFALATRCKLLVMDEPTNGLDIPSKVLFRKIVASSLTDEQLVIISTHQVKDVENLINQIVILDQGKIIFNEDIAAITGKLSFIEAPSLSNQHILYSEQSPLGYKFIVARDGMETNLDIEVLFNAITNGKLSIQ